MLTTEVLKANDILSGLSDEQLSAITTLSQNDENTVIGNRFGEVYRTFDDNIFKASGISRNGDEKTYVYLDRVLGELKDKGADAEKRVTELTKENARLTKALSEGSADDEVKKALTQAQKDLQSITNQYNSLKNDYDKVQDEHKKAMFGLKIDAELSNAKSGIKFKAGLPQAVTEVIMQNAMSSVKSMNPEFIDNGNGGKVLAFKDKDGAVMRNPENQLNPFTASDLLRNELKKLGVLDEGIHQTGGGTEPPTKSDPSSTLDLSGARTRVEASDIIEKQLLSQGLTRGSAKYQMAFDEAWKTNNISALPQR